MLEAPEAVIISRQLNETVKGKTITEVVAGFSPHKFAWYYKSPDLYPQMLLGKRIGHSRPQGGIVETTIEDMVFLFCDGVNFRYIGPGGKLPDKHQLLLGFDDESCLTVSVRMYGGLMCLPQDREPLGYEPYYNAARTKPQVMSAEFTPDYFMGLFERPGAEKKSAKAFLATGQNIPGLGNGVLQDILFDAGINPKTKVGLIPEASREELYYSLKKILRLMLEQGGRDSESDIFGVAGKYAQKLSKDTAGKPCGRCGRLIIKENYLGGSIYYCPGCQQKK